VRSHSLVKIHTAALMGVHPAGSFMVVVDASAEVRTRA